MKIGGGGRARSKKKARSGGWAATNRSSTFLFDSVHLRYTYWLGEQPVVAVTDYQKIIDTFQKDGAAYEGRLVSAEMDRITRGILKLSGQKTLRHQTHWRSAC